MESDESLDAFHFDDDPVFDDEVGSMYADLPSFVQNRNVILSDELETCVRQFKAQCFFVRPFQHPWTQLAVHLHRAADDSVSKRVMFVQVALSILSFGPDRHVKSQG